MSEDKATVARSFAYQLVDRFAVKGIGFVVSIVLARIISQEAFGELAILMVFVTLSQTIVESGLNTALVQAEEVDETDYSSVFYLSLLIAVILVCILWASAPIIATFYSSLEIIDPLRVISLILLFGSFNSVQTAKMQREMNFRGLMIGHLLSALMSGVVGISMAFNDFGLWSLVAYTGAGVVGNTVFLLLMERWLPSAVFSKQRAKKLFNYGWKMLVSAILCSLYASLRSLVIGKKYSAYDLANYERGRQIPEILSMTLDSVIQSVMFPVMSRRQSSLEAMRECLNKSVSVGMFVVFPLMLLLAFVSSPVILLLFTEKWAEAIPLMTAVCVAQMVITVTSSNLVAIKASGRSDVYMRLELIRRAMMLAILILSVVCFDTVLAIAVGYVVSSWLDALITCCVACRCLKYSMINQLKGLWKTALASLVMAAVLQGASLAPLPCIASLAVSVIVGFVSYLVSSILLKNDALAFVLTELKAVFFFRSDEQH